MLSTFHSITMSICTLKTCLWDAGFVLLAFAWLNHPSIHILPLIRGRVAGAAVWTGTPGLSSPRTVPSALLGGSQGMVEWLLQVHKALVDWQSPIKPQAPCREYRTGLVFHGQDENHIVPPESEVLLSAKFSSTVPWNRLSQGGWGVLSPDSCNTPSSPPFWIGEPPPGLPV